MRRRAFIILLDGVGVGALPDAEAYGDSGANTFLHVAERSGPLRLPEMCRLGMGNILAAPGIDPVPAPEAAFGRMMERSAGKDTTAGHWEIGGVILEKGLPVFPDGFPDDLIERFEKETGRGTLGNKAASGTEIINELGEEHLESGALIVYTSADSVFQVAAHEDVIPPEELYRLCLITRRFLTGEWGVARVIARPFTGVPGSFRRTPRRRDFSLPPPGRTVFETIAASGRPVLGIGKIHDIYTGRGITESLHTSNNGEGVLRMTEAMEKAGSRVAFVNLNDFDSLWGHRNDPESFARGLEEFDRHLPRFRERLREEDLLILTADHGNDPTTPGTDHTREHVFLLALGPGVPPGRDLGTRKTFADVAATLARHFGLAWDGPGEAIQE